MALPSVTPNYKLKKPAFDESPWHDDVNGNMDQLDSILTAGIGVSNLLGLWDISTAYVVGDRAVDTSDSSVWECQIAHTSPAGGTFEAARAVEPTFWAKISVGFLDIKGEWAASTQYFVGDHVQCTPEYVVAICETAHTSGATFRPDSDYWVYFLDIKDAVLSTIANATAAVTAATEAQVAKIVWKGQWVTATVYEVNDAIKENGSSYICVEAHTSGTFATDLTATKWEILAQKGASGSGSGDMVAADYDPGNVAGNAFAMDNMVEGANTKIMTGAERTKLTAIEAGAEVNPLGSEIKTLYEAEANTNAFTDDEKMVLATVAVNADVTSITTVGASINAASTLGAIDDADLFGVYESSASILRKWSWASVVSQLASSLNSVFSLVSHVHAFSTITSKPTTLLGYGITDAATSTHNHDERYYTETEMNALLNNKISSLVPTFGAVGTHISIDDSEFSGTADYGETGSITGYSGIWRCHGPTNTGSIFLFQRIS